MPTRLTLSALAAVTSSALLVIAMRTRPRRVVVTGSSMCPTLLAEDRLVVVACRRRPRCGDLVLLDDPRRTARRLLKRVHTVGDDFVDVRGDAAAASTDSRTFGVVPTSAVTVVTAYRYSPADRVGWVDSRPDT